jgi:hypothetical protein
MAKPIKVEMLQTWMGTTYRVYVHGGVLGRGVDAGEGTPSWQGRAGALAAAAPKAAEYIVCRGSSRKGTASPYCCRTQMEV